MCGLLKSMVLGAALLTGMALAAQAQSVSASPPAGGQPPAQSAQAHPFGPKPGGGKVWKEQHPQLPADYATNPAYHPYSSHGMGPQADTPWLGTPPKNAAVPPAAPGNTQGPKTN